jgi:hypothetical protein
VVPHSQNLYVDYTVSKHLATGFKILLKSLLVTNEMWVLILLHIRWHLPGVALED